MVQEKTLLLQITNRKCYVAYQIMIFSTTFSNLRSLWLSVCHQLQFFTSVFLNSFAAVVTLAIELTTRHFIKFYGNGEIPWQQVNSVAWLEFRRPRKTGGHHYKHVDSTAEN